MKNNYFIFAFVAALLFGLSTPLTKLLLIKDLHPIFLASLFYLGAAVFLIPFSYKNFSREYRHVKQNKKDVLRLVGSVVSGGILAPVFLLYGIKLINASTASLLLNLEVVATTFLAWFLFKEHLNKKIVLSLLFTVVAGSLLVFNKELKISMGGILVVLACVFWGFDNNFTATIEGVSPKTNTIIKGLFGGLFNLTVAVVGFNIDFNIRIIIFALLIGFFSYGLSTVFYIYSARNLGAARSQIIFSINPFLGALVSFLIFRNALDLKFYFALLMMLTGFAILYFEKHGHAHAHICEEHEHEHLHNDDHHYHKHEGLPLDVKHTHKHSHDDIKHGHPHYPDLHHRHKH